MGQKINPISTRTWLYPARKDGTWFSQHYYSQLFIQHIVLQKYVKSILLLNRMDTARLNIELYPSRMKLVIAYRLLDRLFSKSQTKQSLSTFPNSSDSLKSRFLSSNRGEKLRQHTVLDSSQTPFEFALHASGLLTNKALTSLPIKPKPEVNDFDQSLKFNELEKSVSVFSKQLFQNHASQALLVQFYNNLVKRNLLEVFNLPEGRLGLLTSGLASTQSLDQTNQRVGSEGSKSFRPFKVPNHRLAWPQSPQVTGYQFKQPSFNGLLENLAFSFYCATCLIHRVNVSNYDQAISGILFHHTKTLIKTLKRSKTTLIEPFIKRPINSSASRHTLPVTFNNPDSAGLQRVLGTQRHVIQNSLRIGVCDLPPEVATPYAPQVPGLSLRVSKNVSSTAFKNCTRLDLFESSYTNYALFPNQREGIFSFYWLNMRSPLCSADLLSGMIVQSLENRESFRKISRQIVQAVQQSPYLAGIRLMCSGRIQGSEMARVEIRKYGQTSNHELTSRVDYASRFAVTSYGLFGVQVWLCFRSRTQFMPS